MTTRSTSSLTILGTGIKFLSHLTTEAKAYLEQASHVLYLINEPAMQQWICKINPNATSLDFLYQQNGPRANSYDAITQYILEKLKITEHLCVALYGHPTLYAQPALNAAKIAKQQGYDTRILPGISAEDCLLADLGINPGSQGCLSYEATDLLIHERPIDPRSHLIIWQVGVIGELNHTSTPDATKGLELLTNVFLRQYSEGHHITLYVASQYPTLRPNVQQLTVKQLAQSKPPRLATLYVPPEKPSRPNPVILRQLGIT